MDWYIPIYTIDIFSEITLYSMMKFYSFIKNSQNGLTMKRMDDMMNSSLNDK